MSVLIDPVVSKQFSSRVRVERGSACSGSDSGDSRGASRDAEPPEARFYAVGFRICLSRSRATTGEV
jgi:formylglycine-generating enzyme required for sulfatase activity